MGQDILGFEVRKVNASSYMKGKTKNLKKIGVKFLFGQLKHHESLDGKQDESRDPSIGGTMLMAIF